MQRANHVDLASPGARPSTAIFDAHRDHRGGVGDHVSIRRTGLKESAEVDPHPGDNGDDVQHRARPSEEPTAEVGVVVRLQERREAALDGEVPERVHAVLRTKEDRGARGVGRTVGAQRRAGAERQRPLFIADLRLRIAREGAQSEKSDKNEGCGVP